MKANFRIYLFYCLLSFICIVCKNAQNSSDASGFYQNYSYRKNKGEIKIDTTLTKQDNGINNNYCFVDPINDSTRKIVWFRNFPDGPYYDTTEISVTFAFRFGQTTIYESDHEKRATGPTKEYYLVNDSVYSKFVFYPYLERSPGLDKRMLLLKYDENVENGLERVIRHLYILPADSIDFRHTLLDPIKLKRIISTARVE